MHADLVCTSCSRIRFDPRPRLPPFKHLEVCFRIFTPFMDHYRAVPAADIGPQQVFGDVLIPGRDTFHDGLIHLLDFVPLKLTVEFAMRFCRAGKDHHAAGDLVQAVNNPDVFVLVFQHLSQIGCIWLPAIGQHGQIRRFVDNDDVLIGV